MHTVKCFANGA